MARDEPGPTAEGEETRTFLIVLGGTLLLGFAAYGFSLLLDTPFQEQFRWDARDMAAGVAAVAPMTLFLWWFTSTRLEHLSSFRRSQIKFFSEIGFRFTPLRIVLMSLGAGICEELFFRGVLQTWTDRYAHVAIAIVASNVVFGLLHMRTALYAIIAGLVGMYLGALYAITGNLLAPMTAHALYDAVALEYTRRAVIAYQAGARP